MHDALSMPRKRSPAETPTMAKTAKLDMKKFEKDRNCRMYRGRGKRHQEGDAIQLQGTPSIYLNGLLINSPDELQDAIDEARAFERVCREQ